MTIAVITGGSGRIASAVRPYLQDAGWTVRLLDTSLPPGELAETEYAFVGTLFDKGLLDDALTGADVVVHFAAHRSERPWNDILSVNVDGTVRVFEAAQRAGVRRVLYASSVHAVGFQPFDRLADAEVLLPRPDTYYGFSKAAGEAISSLFADRFGMSVVSARIGYASPDPEGPQMRITWLSAADAARLIQAVAALEEPGHHIVWGMSKGAEGHIPLEPGRRIGYDPQDDARQPGDADAVIDAPAGTEFTVLPLGEDWP